MTSSIDRKLERVAREIAEAKEKAGRPTEGLTPTGTQPAPSIWDYMKARKVLTDADADADLNGTPRPTTIGANE